MRNENVTTASLLRPHRADGDGRPYDITLGVDVGGTKTEIRLDSNDARLGHWVVPSSSWRTDSDTVIAEDILALVSLLRAHLDDLAHPVDLAHPGGLTHPGDPLPSVAICVGLHSADTKEQIGLAQNIIDGAFPGRSLVVNDAELLGPTAGERNAINLVVGTGMIAVGRSARGELIRSDGYGYGWALSEYGSAPALARESIRTLLAHATLHGDRAALDDPLGRVFATELGVRTIPDLTVAFGSRMGDASWGALAHLTFDALEEGSSLAERVVAEAVRHIHSSITSVRRRGVDSTIVVAAGGVITHQTTLAQRLAAVLSTDPDGPLTLRVLSRPPVEGAVALARAIISKPSSAH